jgi:hypothetical protein
MTEADLHAKIDDIIATHKERDGVWPVIVDVLRELAGPAFADAPVEDLCPPKSHLPLTTLLVTAARAGLSRLIVERRDAAQHRATSVQVAAERPTFDGFSEERQS